jgi:hypothetical protein
MSNGNMLDYAISTGKSVMLQKIQIKLQKLAVCFRYRSHVFVFIRKGFRMSEFAFG